MPFSDFLPARQRTQSLLTTMLPCETMFECQVPARSACRTLPAATPPRVRARSCACAAGASLLRLTHATSAGAQIRGAAPGRDAQAAAHGVDEQGVQAFPAGPERKLLRVRPRRLSRAMRAAQVLRLCAALSRARACDVPHHAYSPHTPRVLALRPLPDRRARARLTVAAWRRGAGHKSSYNSFV